MSAVLRQKASVVRFPRRKQKYAHDAVFFTKDQIRIGVTLLHVGRLDPSAWVVVRIVHIAPRGGRHYVEAVGSFADLIYMRRANGAEGPLKRSTFSYLCYSAVWRVG